MKTTAPVIETARLWLRPLDVAQYLHLFSECSDAEISAYFGFRTTEDLEKERDKYRKGVVTFNRHFHNFLLVHKETAEVIGACGYHTWFIYHNRAELGYAIYDDAHKNKGYMSEALKAVIRYGFEHMGLNRIEALVGPENVPSLTLIHNMGFLKEGILREHYVKNDVAEDSVAFALLRKDYKQ